MRSTLSKGVPGATSSSGPDSASAATAWNQETLLIGASGGLAGFWGVGALKHRLRIDDTLDVFGIHGVGGIVGSIGTGIVSSPLLGGFRPADYSIASQTIIQGQAVAVAILCEVWAFTPFPQLLEAVNEDDSTAGTVFAGR